MGRYRFKPCFTIPIDFIRRLYLFRSKCLVTTYSCRKFHELRAMEERERKKRIEDEKRRQEEEEIRLAIDVLQGVH